MKKSRGRVRKYSSVLLALLLCIALMPVGVFADDEYTVQEDAGQAQELVPEADGQAESDALESAGEAGMAPEAVEAGEPEVTEGTADDSQTVTPADPEDQSQTDAGETEEETIPDEGEYVDPDVNPEDLVNEMTINGIEVQFDKKEDKVYKTPDKEKDLIPGRVWVHGNKASMKVSWENPEGLSVIDGVIILRATGKQKVFKEVKRLAFTSVKDGEIVSKPKTSYTDTTAKKKNTTYTYRVISYISLGDVAYVSNLSKNDWAAGRTSTSKLKNVYTAAINKKKAKLQSKEKTTLKLTVKSPKTKFMPSNIRWFSSNKVVATVSSKGKVTAKAPGTAVIRGRLASGYEIKSTITVKGAFKPGTSTLKTDYATKNSIALVWTKAKYATSYDVYKSNDGLHWEKPKNTTSTTYKFTGLKEKHRYTFYVIARNDHKGVDKNGDNTTYTELGDNSNVINQKAVIKRRPMTLTGFPTKAQLTTGTTYTKTIKVEPPLGRKAELQMKSGRKWVKKKTIKLPKGSAKKSVSITFPNDWWDGKTEWRLVIPPTVTTDGFTTEPLKITAKRAYQNPSSYVQIKDSISKHGYSHYVSPVLINSRSTQSGCIEALIKTANKYKGDKYVQSRSGAPGKGIDESGLVMQACYGAGVDLWPISPSTRPYNCVPKIMDSKLKKITYPKPDGNNYPGVNRGDLIFFASSKNGTPIHVAIYLGWGEILHADPVKGKVNTSTIKTLEDQSGDYQYYVVGVRRIFN